MTLSKREANNLKLDDDSLANESGIKLPTHDLLLLLMRKKASADCATLPG